MEEARGKRAPGESAAGIYAIDGEKADRYKQRMNAFGISMKKKKMLLLLLLQLGPDHQAKIAIARLKVKVHRDCGSV
jgi:hypothetical protein